MTQRFPPDVFLCSTQFLIENVFSAVCTSRSEVRYGDRFWNLLKDTWHDSFNKVEQWFQVWKATPVENDVFYLSNLRFDYFLSENREFIICMIQDKVSKSRHYLN